ncbi:hypothetical protein OG381_38430 [Streptomyces sp. NBC_00490]
MPKTVVGRLRRATISAAYGRIGSSSAASADRAKACGSMWPTMWPTPANGRVTAEAAAMETARPPRPVNWAPTRLVSRM